jgi:hypothetical protein
MSKEGSTFQVLVGFALGLDGLKDLLAGLTGSYSGLAYMVSCCVVPMPQMTRYVLGRERQRWAGKSMPPKTSGRTKRVTSRGTQTSFTSSIQLHGQVPANSQLPTGLHIRRLMAVPNGANATDDTIRIGTRAPAVGGEKHAAQNLWEKAGGHPGHPNQLHLLNPTSWASSCKFATSYWSSHLQELAHEVGLRR